MNARLIISSSRINSTFLGRNSRITTNYYIHHAAFYFNTKESGVTSNKKNVFNIAALKLPLELLLPLLLLHLDLLIY